LLEGDSERKAETPTEQGRRRRRRKESRRSPTAGGRGGWNTLFGN